MDCTEKLQEPTFVFNLYTKSPYNSGYESPWRKRDLSLTWKGYFYLCPRMDFLQTLHINNSLYTNFENVFIEIDC